MQKCNSADVGVCRSGRSSGTWKQRIVASLIQAYRTLPKVVSGKVWTRFLFAGTSPHSHCRLDRRSDGAERVHSNHTSITGVKVTSRAWSREGCDSAGTCAHGHPDGDPSVVPLPALLRVHRLASLHKCKSACAACASTACTDLSGELGSSGLRRIALVHPLGMTANPAHCSTVRQGLPQETCGELDNAAEPCPHGPRAALRRSWI